MSGSHFEDRSISRVTSGIISVVCLSFLTVGWAIADQKDSTCETVNVAFRPLVRSAQVDGTIFLYGAAYGGSVDIDIFQMHTTQPSSIGVRLGLERVGIGGPGGLKGGSPYLDYCSLVRLSFLGHSWRFDALLGYAYQQSKHPDISSSRPILRSGAELKWKILPGLFGLMLKGNASKSEAFIGIGVYGGWED